MNEITRLNQIKREKFTIEIRKKGREQDFQQTRKRLMFIYEYSKSYNLDLKKLQELQQLCDQYCIHSYEEHKLQEICQPKSCIFNIVDQLADSIIKGIFNEYDIYTLNLCTSKHFGFRNDVSKLLCKKVGFKRSCPDKVLLLRIASCGGKILKNYFSPRDVIELIEQKHPDNFRMNQILDFTSEISKNEKYKMETGKRIINWLLSNNFPEQKTIKIISRLTRVGSENAKYLRQHPQSFSWIQSILYPQNLYFNKVSKIIMRIILSSSEEDEKNDRWRDILSILTDIAPIGNEKVQLIIQNCQIYLNYE